MKGSVMLPAASRQLLQQLMPLLLLLLVVMMMSVVERVDGYPQGAPPSACEDMFPVGHEVDAKTIDPPYTLSASPTTIAAGDTVTLTLVATGDTTYPYYEGVFVQARKANCGDKDPVGTFSLPQGDDFLKLMDCSQKTASAVTQKMSSHETNRTFTWTVPASYQGRVYFRATVVKNKENFWTNVFSTYLTYANDTSPAPTEYCKVRSKLDESSSVSALTASLISAAVAICVSLLWKL